MEEKFYKEKHAFAALQKGKEEGLNFFYSAYSLPLMFFSLSIINNQPASQEIVSDAFLKLWQNRETVEEWKKVKHLLYRIVRNASIDYLRNQKRQTKNLEDFKRNDSIEQSVLNKMIESETNHRLYQLLSTLPPRGRQIFQMFYFQEKSIKEIASELNISVNTVKTQKQRALQILRNNKSSFYVIIILLLFV